MCFIQLTLINFNDNDNDNNDNDNDNERTIWVNAHKIVCMNVEKIQNKIHTYMEFDNYEHSYLRVKETPDEIINKIKYER